MYMGLFLICLEGHELSVFSVKCHLRKLNFIIIIIIIIIVVVVVFVVVVIVIIMIITDHASRRLQTGNHVGRVCACFLGGHKTALCRLLE